MKVKLFALIVALGLLVAPLMAQQPNGTRYTLYNNTNLTTAISSVAQTPIIGLPGATSITLEAQFTYGSGGTSADAYIQTSVDAGATWYDIANFHFLTTTGSKLSTVVAVPATPFTAGTAPGTGALAANTVLNGPIGDRLRALIVTTGTYAGNTAFRVDAVIKGR